MGLSLLGIFGSYAISIALVHWFYRPRRGHNRKMNHFLLITLNNQMQIEWYIRSLQFFSRLKGREIRVTIADEGSTDDTLAIIDRFRREEALELYDLNAYGSWEEWIGKHEEEPITVMRLSSQDSLETAFRSL